MPERASVVARIVNVVLGAWIAASAFLWPHLPAARENAAVAGALVAVVALAALRTPKVHWLNAAVGLWLFAAVWIVPHASEASKFNDAISAFFVMALALVPAPGEAEEPPPAPHRVRA